MTRSLEDTFSISRRSALRLFGTQSAALAAGAFGVASSLTGKPLVGGAAESNVDPLAPHLGHYLAKAKSVVFVFSTGGASHVDSFDYKPKLFADHGKSINVDNWQGKLGKFERFLKRPNWTFRQYGQSGSWISDLFPNLGGVADELAIINSVNGDHTGHDKATMGMHTGSFNFARPSIGAWVSYGLGTENRNLPSFMVLAPSPPYAGAQTWGSDFLPGCHQGTQVIPGKDPLPNVTRRVADETFQKLELELLAEFNRRHGAGRANDAGLEARSRTFETAFGMQREAPEAFDLSRESAETQRLYGLAPGATTGVAWQCLVARRLIERGVRFVEVIDSGSGSAANWDSHGDMQAHAPLAKALDQPLAALVADLKRRGMLDETLVVWTTEFGRTPYNTSADAKGREHHHQVFSSWLAGGGIRGGVVHGKSDDHGVAVAEDKVHVHDLHATILHCLGIDHERLTFRYAGRDFRLTDVAGRVVREILA